MQQDNNKSVEINEFGEIIRHGNIKIPREIETFEEVTPTKNGKEVEEIQEEKIRPREKSIRDEVGDEIKKEEQQAKKINNPTDLWMNRFNGWYSSIDRVSQTVKAKFVKMKSDIIKDISEKLKERTNYKQINTQEQDTNERQVIHLKQEYIDAFSEVNEIIKMMPDELTNKIPSKFKKMIEDERNKEYNPNIQEPLEKQKLKNETIIILGLIYRDEKKRLQEKDAKELQEVEKTLEEEIREKYNPDDIFKDRNRIVPEEIQASEETRMTIVQKDKWYKKICNLIKGLFHSNK